MRKDCRNTEIRALMEKRVPTKTTQRGKKKQVTSQSTGQRYEALVASLFGGNQNNYMKALLIWAFLAGLLNGIILRMQDFFLEMEVANARKPVCS